MEWIRRLSALVLALAMLMSMAAVAEDEADAGIPEEAAVEAEDLMVDEEPTQTPEPEMTSVADLPGLDSKYLMLASPAEPLEANYAPLNLVSITSRRNDDKGNNENGGLYMASSASMHLTEDTLAALTEMFNAAEAEDITLYVRQTYRSYADEGSRYERMLERGTPSEVPGQIDWQTGLAVTVVSKSLRTKSLTVDNWMGTKEGKWVSANAGRFGFIVRYPQGKEDVTGHAAEPWHLRYVGENVAEYMQNEGIALEEFRQELDAIMGEYVMPEGDPNVRDTWMPSSNARRATATEVPRVSPTPVPDVLPGGAKLLDEDAEGDWEFSLFGN